MFDMYDLSSTEPDWRHAETFENRVLVAHRYMHCGLGSQQRSLREVWLLHGSQS